MDKFLDAYNLPRVNDGELQKQNKTKKPLMSSAMNRSLKLSIIGDGIVVQAVKSPLATPASHMRATVRIVAALLLIQRPDSTPRKALGDGPIT